jgi:hypothetical protein
MRGQILEWNNGKGYRRGLMVADKQIKSLAQQGRAVVYILDENLNIKITDGKKEVALVTLSKTKCIGFQD